MLARFLSFYFNTISISKMATYRLKRKTFSSDSLIGGITSMISSLTDRLTNGPTNVSQHLTGKRSDGFLSGIIGAIKGFFTTKSTAGKYKATEEEIKETVALLPKDYAMMKEIKLEVMKKCRFIFTCDASINLFCNTLPSFLNLNGEEFIAGWKRETLKKTNGRVSYAPILSMFNCRDCIFWDFTNSYWFFFRNGEEYRFKEPTPWKFLLSMFEGEQKYFNENKEKFHPQLFEYVKTYLELNIKLIKKYGKV